MVFGDYFPRRIASFQERSSGAWEYTGYNDPMRTHVGERWDWSDEDAKTVVRRVSGLDTVEQTLILDGDPPPLQRPRPGEHPGGDDGGGHRGRSAPPGRYRRRRWRRRGEQQQSWRFRRRQQL
ncbi:hypothetical protein OsJ_01888 [Oryza sativa Japonica Group]|uniref:Uncharacterized protein n=1 Tax=Oryza sativa subsp. japonica TaxID=39947 RepID=A2ZTG0_ORYSJ|nr:hypothetical protein OsJ_01888 [Oryza sativa Japonica Group]